MSLTRHVTFWGGEPDAHGMPEQWHSYLVVSGPGPGDACIATAVVVAGDSPAMNSSICVTGDEETALREAIDRLSDQHDGLKRRVDLLR